MNESEREREQKRSEKGSTDKSLIHRITKQQRKTQHNHASQYIQQNQKRKRQNKTEQKKSSRRKNGGKEEKASIGHTTKVLREKKKTKKQTQHREQKLIERKIQIFFETHLSFFSREFLPCAHVMNRIFSSSSSYSSHFTSNMYKYTYISLIIIIAGLAVSSFIHSFCWVCFSFFLLYIFLFIIFNWNGCLVSEPRITELIDGMAYTTFIKYERYK